MQMHPPKRWFRVCFPVRVGPVPFALEEGGYHRMTAKGLVESVCSEDGPDPRFRIRLALLRLFRWRI